MKRLIIVAIMAIIWSHVSIKCIDHFKSLMNNKIVKIELIK